MTEVSSAEFVSASRLFDVDSGERIQWDWGKMQPVAESQAEIEIALKEKGL